MLEWALVQVMVRWGMGDKPLPEPMMPYFTCAIMAPLDYKESSVSRHVVTWLWNNGTILELYYLLCDIL